MKELNTAAIQSALKYAELKENFVKGFMLGRKITIFGLKRYARWEWEPHKNQDHFVWRGKRLMTFNIPHPIKIGGFF